MIIGITDTDLYKNSAEIYYSVNWVDDSGGYLAEFFKKTDDAKMLFNKLKAVEFDMRLTVALISIEGDQDIIDEEILDSFYVEE